MSDEQSNRRSSDGQTATVGIAIAAVVAVIVLLCVCIVVVLAILTLLGPAIGNVFSSTIPLQECSTDTDVIVFEDTDADGTRDTGEAGVENIKIGLMVDGRADVVVERTDADGLAHVGWYNANCQNTKQYDIVVDVPDGFESTTGTTAFGPYPVAFNDDRGPLYVGLSQSP